MARKPQPGWAIYKEQMDFLCFGDALWEPSPTNKYPRVNIGDVGFIRRGKFHLLFSAGSPLEDRRLGDDVPTTFEPLDVGDLDSSLPRQPGCLRTSTVRQFGAGLGATASASLPLEPGANFSFELTEDRGAALVTKYSTYRVDTLVEDACKEYTERHYKSWVEFARNKRYGKDVHPILVTGFDATRDFAMVAYSHEGTSLESDLTITVPALASASASLWGTWHTRCSPHTNYGPQEYGPISLGRTTELPSPQSTEAETIPTEFNQCVFIRYFTMRWRMAIFPKVIRAGAGPHDLGSGDNASDAFQKLTIQPDAGRSAGSDDDLEGQPGPSTDDDGSKPKIVVHNIPSDGEYDGWNAIADYVFQNSDAVCALMHHRDLARVRRAGDTGDVRTLLVKHKPPIRIGKNGVGRIVCEEIQRTNLQVTVSHWQDKLATHQKWQKPPIYFLTGDIPGIRLCDAMHMGIWDMNDRDSLFDGDCDVITIRIQFQGYKSSTEVERVLNARPKTDTRGKARPMQISTKINGVPMNKGRLLIEVAKRIQWYIYDLDYNQDLFPFDPHVDEQWRIGRGQMKFKHMFITRLDNVSFGSWSPIIHVVSDANEIGMATLFP